MSFQYTSGDPSHLTGGANASMADIQGPFTDLRTFLNARIAAIPTLVSSLPVSPVDAQEIYYQADGTNGVIWHLRYRAASASTFKWEFVGGAPLMGSVDAPQNVSATSPSDAATVGPDVTVPLAGDYDYLGAVQASGVGGATTAVASISVAGAAPVTTTDAFSEEVAAAGGGAIVLANRKTSLAASTLLRMKYSSTAGVAVEFSKRRLRVWPVRVG